MTASKPSIIITGAAAGIGAVMAAEAAEAGYRVGALDVDAEGAERTAASLPDAAALHASVNDQEAVEAAFEVFGGAPDVLINNAGVVLFGPLLELSADDWRKAVEVNLTGTYLCARAAARRMIAEELNGCIVNVASINGIAPGPNAGAYSSTKAAVIMLTKQMALEWGKHGLRVNCVAPGLIEGGMSAPINADPVLRAEREGVVPLGRLGTEVDIARTALWLASEDSSYVTGQTLTVDGGISMSILGHLPRPKHVDGVGPDAALGRKPRG